MALLSAFIFDKVLKVSKYKSFFIAEMPDYKVPMWRNVGITVYEKTKGFVMGAGKYILAISILLWFLGSHGMGEHYHNIEATADTLAQEQQWDDDQKTHYIESEKLEYSFLGYIGKGIEPVFRPLGYDWKISIGVVASFAAREVFISTLSSVYSLGGDLDTEEAEGERTCAPMVRRSTPSAQVYRFCCTMPLRCSALAQLLLFAKKLTAGNGQLYNGFL